MSQQRDITAHTNPCSSVSSWVSSHKLPYLPIPRHVAQGRHGHAGVDYRFLVMDCFGEDVEKKFNQCGRRFGSKTVCHLAIRIVSPVTCSVFQVYPM